MLDDARRFWLSTTRARDHVAGIFGVVAVKYVKERRRDHCVRQSNSLMLSDRDGMRLVSLQRDLRTTRSDICERNSM